MKKDPTLHIGNTNICKGRRYKLVSLKAEAQRKKRRDQKCMLTFVVFNQMDQALRWVIPLVNCN